MWEYREHLNYFEKLRRSLYEVLRDVLEQRLIKISLVDSFYNFQKQGIEYQFLDKSELKPQSKKTGKESSLFNTFIVIFCEGTVSPTLKNHLRFFPENTVVKKNLEHLVDFTLYRQFHRNLRYFDNPTFLTFVEELLHIDYALLIQQDPTIKKKNRYVLSHFHVKVDWPIADAAEDLAKWLRYIQNNLYENGDKYGIELQKKMFEYYGCNYSVGGRRTAGLIAAQLLRKMDFISTVFVSSSESRALYKYSERGVSKFYLVQLNEEDINDLAQRKKITLKTLKSNYLYDTGDFYFAVSEAYYKHTDYGRPPENGKLRKLKPIYAWLKLSGEFLHPKIDALTARPINY
ncbi:MAG: hypothetical protein B1H12_09265 [Desulfobacteraceae bacterium 4484_190.2]|nr:MAG: hypothetical protein B1H12_09265 [Desulfobacteraceae bacterium 4484_190.2]